MGKKEMVVFGGKLDLNFFQQHIVDSVEILMAGKLKEEKNFSDFLKKLGFQGIKLQGTKENIDALIKNNTVRHPTKTKFFKFHPDFDYDLTFVKNAFSLLEALGWYDSTSMIELWLPSKLLPLCLKFDDYVVLLAPFERNKTEDDA